MTTRIRSTLAPTLLALTLALAAMPSLAARTPPSGRNPPKPAPVSEPAPVNLNPLAAFWAHWAAYWGS